MSEPRRSTRLKAIKRPSPVKEVKENTSSESDLEPAPKKKAQTTKESTKKPAKEKAPDSKVTSKNTKGKAKVVNEHDSNHEDSKPVKKGTSKRKKTESVTSFARSSTSKPSTSKSTKKSKPSPVKEDSPQEKGEDSEFMDESSSSESDSDDAYTDEENSVSLKKKQKVEVVVSTSKVQPFSSKAKSFNFIKDESESTAESLGEEEEQPKKKINARKKAPPKNSEVKSTKKSKETTKISKLQKKEPQKPVNDEDELEEMFNLPELAAPRLWSNLLNKNNENATKPSNGEANEELMESDSESESENEEGWHEVKTEAVKRPHVAVEIKLDKADLEKANEKMLRKELEKWEKDRDQDICRLQIVAMIAHSRWQMTYAKTVPKLNGLDWCKELEEKINLGSGNMDVIGEVLNEFKDSFEVKKTVENIPKAWILRYQWCYQNKVVMNDRDFAMVCLIFLLKCNLDCRLVLAFNVPFIPSAVRNSKKNTVNEFKGPYYSLEYYSEGDEKWIPIALRKSIVVDDYNAAEKSWPHPCSYVFVADNNVKIKDLSSLYCSSFTDLAFRKTRVEPEFIQTFFNITSMQPHGPRALKENEQIQAHLMAKSIPTKINEFKNHPLYALEKDLLKFEAIYPKDIKPIGEIRGQKIYPRSSIHTLQGELNWIRLARSVKPGEEAYKVVKARPKLSIPAEDRVPLFLDTYGYWQTEPYVPPKLVNGKIPRNEYGNVYMYKDCMVPEGCVHLKLNGIQNIARQMNLEAVPAVVGWEFSGGRNHPLLEGCVVLKEHVEALKEAWAEWDALKEERKQKKMEDKVLSNWKRFIKGKILLKKMNKKFNVKD